MGRGQIVTQAEFKFQDGRLVGMKCCEFRTTSCTGGKAPKKKVYRKIEAINLKKQDGPGIEMFSRYGF